MGTKNALLVYPQFPPSYWGFRYALELLGKRSAMPPLGLLTVAAMFPQSYNLRLGHPHVTPLCDWEAGQAKHLYRPASKPAITCTPVPRFELLDLSAYSSMALQFSRGCPFDCEFCDITKLFGRVPRTKSTPQMLAELDALDAQGWRGALFLVDDNFIGNKKEALRLLPAVTKWQREHGYPFDLYTEASVNLAKLEPLLDAMVEAGFTMTFLGIDSPNPEALRRTKKVQNTDHGDEHHLLHAVTAIQRKGIEATGGFILGLDGDGPEVFDAQIDFIQE